jgi:hypothetical protein
MIEETDCVFCFDEVNLNNHYKIVECYHCFHFFHQDCWKLYEKSIYKTQNLLNPFFIKCPLCRKKIFYLSTNILLKTLFFIYFLWNTLDTMFMLINDWYDDDELFFVIYTY